MQEKYYYHAAWLQDGCSKGRAAYISDKVLEPKDFFQVGYRILSGPWPSYKEAAKGRLISETESNAD